MENKSAIVNINYGKNNHRSIVTTLPNGLALAYQIWNDIHNFVESEDIEYNFGWVEGELTLMVKELLGIRFPGYTFIKISRPAIQSENILFEVFINLENVVSNS